MATRRRRTTRVEVSDDRGVFMISVAAELAEMHPQTLRMYEARTGAGMGARDFGWTSLVLEMLSPRAGSGSGSA